MENDVFDVSVTNEAVFLLLCQKFPGSGKKHNLGTVVQLMPAYIGL